MITALLAWPVSNQGSPSLYERIGFCGFSMLGVALFVSGFRHSAGGMNDNLDSLNVGGPVVGMIAAAFLIWLWFDKIVGIISDLLLGCFDVSDYSRSDGNREKRQIQKAIRLYRAGRHQRALDLCEQIIESNSRYASTAATLAHWIENPNGVKFVKHPRTTLVF